MSAHDEGGLTKPSSKYGNLLGGSTREKSFGVTTSKPTEPAKVKAGMTPEEWRAYRNSPAGQDSNSIG
jgi:hypothetical protein